MVRLNSIFVHFPKVLENGMTSFKSKTNNMSHLELPNTENVSFNSGYMVSYSLLFLHSNV